MVIIYWGIKLLDEMVHSQPDVVCPSQSDFASLPVCTQEHFSKLKAFCHLKSFANLNTKYIMVLQGNCKTSLWYSTGSENICTL